MLSFYKSRIFLDIEASIDAQGIIFNCSFLDKEKIKDFFPNLEIRKSMKYYDIFCGRMIVGEGFAIIGRQHLLKGDFL